MRGQRVRVEAPNADAEMAYDEPVLLVHLDAVGPGVSTGELDRDTGLRRRAASHQRQPPDLLRARNGDVHLAVLVVERDAVRRRRVVHQPLQLAARAHSIYAAARIGDAALSLI